MKLYSENKNYKLFNGNMLDMLQVIEKESIDSIVCDPPYELNFMGKGWDNSGIAFNPETWKQCYEVLKPGGYLLAFGGSRTYHRIAVAIEDAGFEIRDTIMWLYGSGFPKSMNIGLAIDKKNGVESEVIGIGQSGSSDTHTRTMNSETKDGKSAFGGEYEIKKATNKWNGWGTCLKPSFEPIIIARKPFKGSLVDNVIKNGVGGLNIDECRVGNETISIHNAPKGTFAGGEYGRGSDTSSYRDSTGRFPANTILTYDDNDFEEVCGGFPYTKSVRSARGGARNDGTTIYNKIPQNIDMNYECGFNDSGSASRYFYCAKASKKDRDEGLDEFEEKKTGELQGGRKEGSAGSIMLNADGTTRVNPYAGTGTPKKNTHPTVKPTELMQYLVRLVTPNNGTILDPFNGSGSTGKAVMYENKERDKNYKYIGIELTEEYLPIAKARIEYVCNQIEEKQITIDDVINE